MHPRPVPGWLRESAGAAVALAIAVVVMGVTTTSPRAALLLDDGDSLITVLFAQALAGGTAHDWAMSTVLFLPEIALVTAVWVQGLGVDATLLISGVLGFVSLYGGFRVASGARGRVGAPVAGALAGYGAVALLALLERTPSRDALELASLSLTTTYYVATVAATLAAIGLVARSLAGGRRGAVIGLAVVSAVSTLSNPLFCAWACAPLGLLLIWTMLRRRARTGAAALAGLLGGTAIGLLGRIPFAPWIANTGVGYADPSAAPASAAYYAGLVADRASDPLGMVGIVAVLGLIAVSVLAHRRLAGAGDLPSTVVAACGWIVPLVVVLGAILLGTHAARYVQPIVFAAPLGLVALVARGGRMRHPASPRAGAGTRLSWVLAAGGLAAALAAVPLASADVARAATRPDPDLACVTRWVDASGRTGGGQFWSVRLPKAHLSDPARLVQVDHRLNAYAWLVDRGDFAVGEVSFLVTDAQSPAFELPPGAVRQVVACGRYSILELVSPLPIGPAHS